MSDDAPTLAPTAFVVEGFSASDIVNRLHDYPRYGDENEFTLENAYRDSLQAMFFIICIGGGLLLIVQWVFFCCQKLCGGLCCCINFCSVSVYKVILALAFMWLLVGTGLSYWGRHDFQNGAQKTYQLAVHMGHIFEGIESDSSTLDTAAVVLEQLTTGSGICLNVSGLANVTDYNAGLEDASDQFSSATGEISSLVDGIAKRLNHVATLFDQDVPTYIDFGIGFITGLMSLTVLSGLWVVSCGSASSQNIMIVVSTFVLMLFCPLIAFEITFSLVLADFCYGLDDTIMVAANRYAPQSAIDLIEHYVYCNNTNPLDPFLNESIASLTEFNSTIYAGAAYCNATSIHRASLQIGNSINAIESIYDSISCVAINPLLTHLMHSIICSDVITGIYNLWSVQLSCALLLWLLLYFVRWEVLQIQREDRVEMLKAEKRLGVANDMFIPTGRMARRRYDQAKQKERDEEERAIAEKKAREDAAREAERRAVRQAREKLIRQAELHHAKKWLVCLPDDDDGPGKVVFTEKSQRREHALVIGSMATAVRSDTDSTGPARRQTTRETRRSVSGGA